MNGNLAVDRQAEAREAQRAIKNGFARLIQGLVER